MIIHTCSNGQKVSFPTAETSAREDGFIKFYDAAGRVVGSQPDESYVAPAPAPAPVEPENSHDDV